MKPEIPYESRPSNGCLAAFFDVGDTLVAPHPSFAEIVSVTCRAHGFDVAAADVLALMPDLGLAFSGGIVGQPPYHTSAEGGRRFWEWVYRSTLDRLGIEAPWLPAAICTEFERPASYRLFADVVPTLERLRSAGIRLGIISNWEPWLPSLLAFHHLADYFEEVFVSGLLDLLKPDPAIFLAAAARMGVPVDRAVHIGDSLRSDYEGARAAGMSALLLDRAKRYQAVGVARVTSLAEVPERLGVSA